MNKIIVIGASTLFLAGCGASAFIDMDTSIAINQTQTTEAPLKLIVDGEAVLPSLPPFFSGDKVYVPAKVLMEYYSSEQKWDNTLKTLTISDGSSKYVLKPGNEYMQGDGYQNALGGPAILRNGNFYIPADALNSLSGADVKLNASRTAVKITSGSVSTTVRKPSQALAVAEENDKVKLYTVLKDGDTYKGFNVEVKGTKHTFNWESPRLLNDPPEIHYADLDQDGQEEVIVILSLGAGTGMSMQEIHVVKPNSWKELTIPSAEKAATALVSSTISKQKEDLLIKLQLKGFTPSMVTLRLPGRAEDGNFDEQAGIGAVTQYMVEAGQLKAETNVYIGFLESIGTLTLVYKAGNDGMEPESIRFEPHEEYASYVEGKQL
ncbi:copper amine oxidase N-terminal domain-containing protein [Paenibacillus sp. FSL R10-2734]|uniref:copper amine oxidase N-terminal domain-containing protein n=1 Tax=Paenibacillus sp. FSL R10-2734 TaxID=2954691 RepID=UPI0030D6EFFC